MASSKSAAKSAVKRLAKGVKSAKTLQSATAKPAKPAKNPQSMPSKAMSGALNQALKKGNRRSYNSLTKRGGSRAISVPRAKKSKRGSVYSALSKVGGL